MARDMWNLVKKEIKAFGEEFDDDDAWNQHKKISRDLSSPVDIINALRQSREGLLDLRSRGITEEDVKDVVGRNSAILDRLFAIPRTDEARFGTTENRSWNRLEVANRVRYIINRFETLLKDPLFAEDEKARNLELQWRKAQDNLRVVETRVRVELTSCARLKMSTIGSSHKLFNASEDSNDESNENDCLFYRDALVAIEEDRPKPGTIVTFDESGCIPSFELLGLTRLECEIDAILVVGDKHQLPPYDPGSNSFTPRRVGTKFAFRTPIRQPRSEEKLRSLLDVSDVSAIALTTQYRVPRDIADILNARIYNNKYCTPREAGVVDRGLVFRHVPSPEEFRKKYVNTNEVNAVLNILRDHRQTIRRGREASLMILTPVRNRYSQCVCPWFEGGGEGLVWIY